MASLRTLRDGGDAEFLLRALGLAEPGLDLLQWIEGNTELIKSERHSRVGLVATADGLCHCKLYLSKSPLQRMLFRLGIARGLRSFDMSLKLRAAGIEVPRPLACYAAPGSLLLLTEGIADALDLKSLWLQDPAPEVFSALLETAARSLARMHGAGFSHGDCKWSNFICVAGKIYFVDLENVAHCAPGRGAQLRDLARFTLNAEDMGAPAQSYHGFLEVYAEAMGISAKELPARFLPQLEALRARHLKSYGARGHRLI